MKGLINGFTKAGLHLEVLDAPIRNGLGMENIVQIDIRRGYKTKELRNEWFRIYPGKDTMIQVRGTDKKLKQLVLLVKESKQEFHETIPLNNRTKSRKNWLQNFLNENNLTKKDVVLQKKDELIIKRFTPAETRYFLMGVDERQLFIAQLTAPAVTVAEARKLLGRSVQFAEGKRRGSSIDRQGEWFFLETSQDQRQTLDTLLKKNLLVVQKKQVIGDHMGRGGNPHTVDELIATGDRPDNVETLEIMNGLRHGKNKDLPYPIRERKVFIRGRVRHQDHKTITFHQWREVVANNEGATAPEARGRLQRGSTVQWFD
jgi:hypothetical protein